MENETKQEKTAFKRFVDWINWQPTTSAKAVIVFSMINNLPHAANLYRFAYSTLVGNAELVKVSLAISDFFTWENAQSILVVGVIDYSIYTLVNHGKRPEDKRTATVFAWMLFVINLLTSDIVGDVYYLAECFSGDKIPLATRITAMLGKSLFSALFAYSLHYFSHLHVWMVEQAALEAAKKHRISEAQHQLSDVQQQLSEAQQQLSTISETYQQGTATHKLLEAAFQQWKTSKSTALAETQQLEAKIQRLENLKKLEESKRTLFVQHQPAEILESSKALSGKLTNMPKEDRDYHAKQQKEAVKHFEGLLN